MTDSLSQSSCSLQVAVTIISPIWKESASEEITNDRFPQSIVLPEVAITIASSSSWKKSVGMISTAGKNMHPNPISKKIPRDRATCQYYLQRLVIDMPTSLSRALAIMGMEESCCVSAWGSHEGRSLTCQSTWATQKAAAARKPLSRIWRSSSFLTPRHQSHLSWFCKRCFNILVIWAHTCLWNLDTVAPSGVRRAFLESDGEGKQWFLWDLRFAPYIQKDGERRRLAAPLTMLLRS